MPIVNSKTGEIRKRYSKEELVKAANLMRGYSLVALCAAGSGHAGSVLSVMDLAAVLYLSVAKIDPAQPQWPERDRIVWSTGHKAPALYTALAMLGFYEIKEIMKLRKLGSPFQGHPYSEVLPGVEVSTGSLGQGLSIGVGMALAGQLDKKDYYVYVLTGDGEHQSGQIWEAVMEAAHYKLDNLVNILDRNKLQIDGEVEKVMKVEPLKEKYESFGWRVIEIDGHEIDEILTAFEQAKTKEAKPTLILAETIKGKGVSFMEGKAEWHGKAPNYDQMVKGLEELGVKDEIPFEEFLAEAKKYQQEVNKKLEDKRPKFKKDYRWNKNEVMKVEMKRTRQGFGVALEKLGEEEAVVCVSHDLTGSINMDSFFKHHPERKERFFNMGVAEQSGTGVAAGLAKAGKLSIFGTYGVFSAGRNLDQLRISVCYSGANVLIIGAHGGILVGADGATHQATEDLFQVCGLPKMKVEVPCDFLETQKAARHLLLSEKGPKYLRYAREATPLVTDEKTPFIFGQANIIRYQGEKENFIDAFKTTLSSEYKTENEDLTIIACGPEVAEAMRAAYILKEEKGVEARVINMHTLKPLDEEAVIKAAQETGIILTAEDHQVGGLGYRISSVISQSTELYGQPVILKMLGLKDKFGTSGSPWELLEEFELSAEYIADKALFLLELKK